MVPRKKSTELLRTAFILKHLTFAIGYAKVKEKVRSVDGKGSPFGGNGDDRRQRRKQGVAVGAAASRMQATAQQTLGAATRPWREAPERARMLTKKHGAAIIWL